MKASFFKQFFRLRSDMIKAKSNGSGGFSTLAVKCTKMVYTYMMSCKWHDTRRNRDLMTCIELTDSKAAEKMGITTSGVRSMRSLASQKLFSILGEDCFDIIRFGDSKALHELYIRLILVSRGYDNIIEHLPKQLTDILASYIGQTDKEFTLAECEHELKLIARYDLLAINSEIDNVSKDKLAYVAEILIGIEHPEKRSEFLKKIVSLSLNSSLNIIM